MALRTPGSAWAKRLLMPLIARHIAREMSAQHPGLGAQEIAAKMRADIGPNAGADANQLVDAVVARLPAAGGGEPAAQVPPSAWVLVAANVLPLAGVLFWGWDAFALIVLFWMENVIIGALNALKMLCADPGDAALWAGKLFMVPFFAVHYGLFTAGHGVFVFSMLGANRYDVRGLWVLEPAARAVADYALALPLAVLVASHLFSFLWNYLYRGEFRRVSLNQLMAQPYGRVVVLHLAIILGGIGALALGSPLWALLVLLALKIGLDLRAHLKEHSSKPR